jgi:hypothetical protein
MTLGDLLIRRTHLAFEMPDQARVLARTVTNLISPSLKSRLDVEQALAAYDDEAARIFSIV